ncbi:MAG TPA: BamA/TamA family outer membrane protein [Polyangiaceae bacterium]|nr:BamA/TamA family outer membrane protein [Polyangiaceae bacterium]
MRRSLTADKRWLAWLWLWGMALLTGCYSLAPGRQAVDRIDIQENTQLRDDEIKGKIATGSSPRFLGIWDGVAFEYAYFDRFVLQQDLARIERYYRSKGYYHSRVRAARVIPTGKQGHVRVEIAVHEGPPTIVRSALPSGLNTVPFEHQAAILNAVEKGLKPGDRFDETIYEQTKDRIRAELKNRGFAWAEVEGRVQVNLLDLSATIQYEIKAGPLFLVRSVTFLGIQDLPREPIRRVFNVNPGDSFSAKDLETGKNALLDLGVLADVQVSWPSGDPQAPTNIPRNKAGQPAVDVVVRCTPAPLRTIKLGVGTELDTIRADVHGVAGWESRNFWGGLRRFTVTAMPGIVFFPTKVGQFESPDRLLPEGKLLASLRQPGFLEPRSTGVLRGNASIFPVLLQSYSDDVILGYRELKGAVGIERMFWNHHLHVGTFFHGQAYYPFTYVGILDDSLRRVLVRYVELSSYLDFRDDSLRPHRGAFLSNSLQLAGGILGGSVSDVKVQPEVLLYAPISSTVTFAVRSTVGFLFPRDYGQALKDQFDEGDTRDQQLLYFRAFYSGGPSSNRGYPYRAVGPHGPGAFLAPNVSAREFRDRCGAGYSEDACRIPLGGLTLWEASAEVRYPILGPLTGAVFADASDVTRDKTTFHFEYLHLSTGMGFRYDTPVGPIRLDVGYRVPGMQKIGGDLDREERDPGQIFGQPIAFSLAVGQAF